jgi:DNA-binding NarL/FixJ family response regulator
VAVVVVVASIPTVRVGLTAMLVQAGHLVAAPEAAPSDAVWLLDAPDPAVLQSFAHQHEDEPPFAAVVLTDDSVVATYLAHAGLRGWACLARDSGAMEIDLAVQAADAGLALLDLPAAAVTVAATPSPASAAPLIEALTARELQVLQLLAEGMPNKAIARALGITENTAKFHVASVCTKLGASSRTEAVTVATRRGLIVL